MDSQHIHKIKKDILYQTTGMVLTNANQIQILYVLSIIAHLKLSIPPTQHELLALKSIH